jgi:hypothetical protein
MAMGRELLLPEHADSWGEFHARLELERERDGRDRRLTPLWWSVAGLLFGGALVSCAYALQGGRWWLWLFMLASLAVDFVMAVRAFDRVERERARRAELALLQDAWRNHLARETPIW